VQIKECKDEQKKLTVLLTTKEKELIILTDKKTQLEEKSRVLGEEGDRLEKEKLVVSQAEEVATEALDRAKGDTVTAKTKLDEEMSSFETTKKNVVSYVAGLDQLHLVAAHVLAAVKKNMAGHLKT